MYLIATLYILLSLKGAFSVMIKKNPENFLHSTCYYKKEQITKGINFKKKQGDWAKYMYCLSTILELHV